MQNFKAIETPVLITMLMAHTSSYGKKKQSVKELIDCKKVIRRLNLEIASRNAVLANVLFVKLPSAVRS